MFFGVFLAFVFNRTGESVLATMLAHLSLNIALGVGGVQISSSIFWKMMAGITGIIAVLLTLVSSRTPASISKAAIVDR